MGFNERLLLTPARRARRARACGSASSAARAGGCRSGCRSTSTTPRRMTAHNRRMTLTFAFNYGGRAEIVDAVQALVGRGHAGRQDHREGDPLAPLRAGHARPRPRRAHLRRVPHLELPAVGDGLQRARSSPRRCGPTSGASTCSRPSREYQRRDRRFGGRRAVASYGRWACTGTRASCSGPTSSVRPTGSSACSRRTTARCGPSPRASARRRAASAPGSSRPPTSQLQLYEGRGELAHRRPGRDDRPLPRHPRRPRPARRARCRCSRPPTSSASRASRTRRSSRCCSARCGRWPGTAARSSCPASSSRCSPSRASGPWSTVHRVRRDRRPRRLRPRRAAAPAATTTASARAVSPEALALLARHPRRPARPGAQRAAVAGHHRGRAPRHPRPWSTTSSAASARSPSSTAADAADSPHGRRATRRTGPGDVGLELEQADGAVGIQAAEHEELAREPGDALRAEVHGAHDQPADELVGVVVGDLGAGAAARRSTGPKSTVSFHAGLRASGNGSTSSTRPARRSTAKNALGADVGLGRERPRARTAARRGRWRGPRRVTGRDAGSRPCRARPTASRPPAPGPTGCRCRGPRPTAGRPATGWAAAPRRRRRWGWPSRRLGSTAGPSPAWRRAVGWRRPRAVGRRRPARAVSPGTTIGAPAAALRDDEGLRPPCRRPGGGPGVVRPTMKPDRAG